MSRRVLMLTWEYPPRVVGGLARHVEALSRALVRQDQYVTVVTAQHPGAPADETKDGVEVVRLPGDHPPTLDFVHGVLQLNLDMLQAAAGLIRNGHQFDLIHAHDWLTAYAGKALKHAYRKPLIATIHATEFGRNGGLHNDLQRYISDVEWWLAFEAWRVICCSGYMREEVRRVFQVPADKIRVIPNGVDPDHFRAEPDGEAAAQQSALRARFALPGESLVFFIGRLVHEKGVEVLLRAAPRILEQRPTTRFVLVGDGPALGHLQACSRELGIANRVHFPGFMDDPDRSRLFRSADVAVFPSLYEPFGIVALEAMAAGVPLVVTDTGGFSEMISHGRNGLKAGPGDPASLAANILAVLEDATLAGELQIQAYQDVIARFHWDAIARKTVSVYDEVLADYVHSPWTDGAAVAGHSTGDANPAYTLRAAGVSADVSMAGRGRPAEGRYRSTGPGLYTR